MLEKIKMTITARVVNSFCYFDIYICENLSVFSFNQISETYVNELHKFISLLVA